MSLYTRSVNFPPPVGFSLHMVIGSLAKVSPLNAAVLSHVRCPNLVIWGTNDEVIPPSDAQYFKRDLSNVEVLMVPEAGHMLHVEWADEVNQAMIEFVSADP